MAATQAQLRRGTTAQHATFTGALAEVTVDTSKYTCVVHDNATAGGFPLALEGKLRAGLLAARPGSGAVGDIYVTTNEDNVYVWLNA